MRRVSIGTWRLDTKTATPVRPTPLHPPAPADTRRDVAGLARGAVLWVHTRTRHIHTNKKGNILKGYGRQVMYQPNTLKDKYIYT